MNANFHILHATYYVWLQLNSEKSITIYRPSLYSNSSAANNAQYDLTSINTRSHRFILLSFSYFHSHLVKLLEYFHGTKWPFMC